MIFAELRGKLGSDFQLAHDRGEDLLTSTAFQLLRYIPVEDGFLPLLRSIQVISGTWAAIGTSASVEVEMWPKLGRAGCPDVLLKVHRQQLPSQIFLVEAKLHSLKSGQAIEETGIEGPTGDVDAMEIEQDLLFDRDQLARYWQALQRDAEMQPAEKCIVYLTSHVTAPMKELEASLARDSTMNLGWLSWYDFWRVAAQAAHARDSLPARDLAELLKHRRLATFGGFRWLQCIPPTEARFFRSEAWFARWHAVETYRHFWR